jgi:cytochrome P450
MNFAGHTMTWLMIELARHPEIQKQVQEHIDAYCIYLHLE